MAGGDPLHEQHQVVDILAIAADVPAGALAPAMTPGVEAGDGVAAPHEIGRELVIATAVLAVTVHQREHAEPTARDASGLHAFGQELAMVQAQPALDLEVAVRCVRDGWRGGRA
jgi:hypothetical protein